MKKFSFILSLIFVLALVSCTGENPSSDDILTESEDSSTQSEIASDPEEEVAYKPVIYLYPEEETEVSVKLYYNGEFLYTYPTYNDGWNVTAYPDGKIISDGQEYSYLFWEGVSEPRYDLSEGFVVKGEDTEDFLCEKLEFLGLTPKEYNEFIVFWVPLMMNNEYNLISFQEEVYTENAVLEISPEPDSMLRVFMAYKALNEKVEVEEQVLTPFERHGFSVIEWGGTEVTR